MSDRERNIRRCVAIAAILLAVVGMVFSQWRDVRSLANGLSSTADAWTEADTLRAGAAYAQLGFAANSGLPDLCFGNQFPNHGTKKMLRENVEIYTSWTSGALTARKDRVDEHHFVYTHYPPGPHWLAGLMTVIFGADRVVLYRSLPIVVGLVSILYLVWELSRRFSLQLAAVALLIFASLPMFGNMMHGLSYQGYALALLLAQLGICLRLAGCKWRSAKMLLALFALAFFQGWLGFDYFFVVSLAPAVVWMSEHDSDSSWKLALMACSTCFCGYVLANVLHFAQVVAYYGSLRVAMADFAAIAQYRSFSEALDGGQRMRPTPAVLWEYLTTHTAHPLHFNAPILLFAACGFLVLVLVRLLQPRHALTMQFAAIPAALVASSCWVLFMPQHSAQHWHFIPRHYFLVVFIVVLCVLPVLSRMRRPTREQFAILSLAVLPTAVLGALVLQGSILGSAVAALLPLAAVESLEAYAFAVVIALSLRHLGFAWTGALRYGPILHASMIIAFISLRKFIWSMGVASPELASAQWSTVAPVALVAGYSFLAIGWVVIRRLDRARYFADSLPATAARLVA